MKLKTLRLTNLMNHVDNRVELADTLTVFTGVSESGKTNTVRGLQQLCENQPAGVDLLRHKAGRGACSETEITGESVSLKPMSVIRRRGKSKNEYEVDGQVLLAFGQGAPKEVTDLLGLSEHAFQVQYRGNFLLNETGGQVARILSASVGLDQIDAAYTEVRKRKTANDTDLRVAEADVKREGDALVGFAGLDEAAGFVASAEALGVQIAVVRGERDFASLLISSLDGMPEDAKDALVWASQYLREAIRSQNALDKASGESAGVAALVDALESLPAAHDTILLDAGNAVAELEKAAATLDDAREDYSEVEYLVERLTAVPRPAAVGIAAAAVAAWKQKSELLAVVREELRQVRDLWAALGAIPESVACIVVEADWAVGEWCDIANRLERSREELVCFKVCESLLIGADKNCAESASALMTAQRELNFFKIENPVCPECGAEQEHWKAV